MREPGEIKDPSAPSPGTEPTHGDLPRPGIKRENWKLRWLRLAPDPEQPTGKTVIEGPSAQLALVFFSVAAPASAVPSSRTY